MAAFVAGPRAGEVYNLGGGKANSCSILEAFRITEKFTGQTQIHSYLDQASSLDQVTSLQAGSLAQLVHMTQRTTARNVVHS